MDKHRTIIKIIMYYNKLQIKIEEKNEKNYIMMGN
jgi:hypothetical protein